MEEIVVPYSCLARISGSDFLVPLFTTDDHKYSLCNCIDGFADNGDGRDILFINNSLDLTKPYISKINRFGFVEAVYGDKTVRRHIVNIGDARGIFMTEELQDVLHLGSLGTKIVKHKFTRLNTECYVIKAYNNDSTYNYVDRDGNTTSDITQAWFTFNKSQAESYAGRLLLKDMKVYESVSVDDCVNLEIYEME